VPAFYDNYFETKNSAVLIISPLTALMEDQKKKLNGGLTLLLSEKHKEPTDLSTAAYTHIFVSPEAARGRYFSSGKQIPNWERLLNTFDLACPALSRKEIMVCDALTR